MLSNALGNLLCLRGEGRETRDSDVRLKTSSTCLLPVYLGEE